MSTNGFSCVQRVDSAGQIEPTDLLRNLGEWSQMITRFRKYAVLAGVGAVALFGTSFANAAAIIGLQVEGAGTQQVYSLGNGNFLGLWGFDNREPANPGASTVDILNADSIKNGFTGGKDSIVNFYNGTNPVNGGASEFDPLTFAFTIVDNARLFDSLWIEWTGGNLVYKQPSGGTTTMNSTNITRQGDPLAPVPIPAALPLLASVLAFFGFMGWRRKAASAA